MVALSITPPEAYSENNIRDIKFSDYYTPLFTNLTNIADSRLTR
jgi:hypothetical protein